MTYIQEVGSRESRPNRQDFQKGFMPTHTKTTPTSGDHTSLSKMIHYNNIHNKLAFSILGGFICIKILHTPTTSG